MVDIFISYRRTQAFMADRIHERLCARFQSSRVFLDRTEIRPGASFPKVIAEQLDAARIVIVLIDPTWIIVQDPRSFKRRLELKNDWVRIELQKSLQLGKIVIPALIDGAVMPRREQLPGPLTALAERNYVKISTERFADDVDDLIRELSAQLGEDDLRKLLQDETHPYPRAGDFKPVAIEGELLESMMAELSHWRVVESPIHDDPRPGTPTTRREIVRNFRFPSFLSAVKFMSVAAAPIDVFGHHPRWENVFQTVRVSLSTWDIGHRPSDRDFKTALMLERLYERFIAEQKD